VIAIFLKRIGAGATLIVAIAAFIGSMAAHALRLLPVLVS
jgi:hypothetical protein